MGLVVHRGPLPDGGPRPARGSLAGVLFSTEIPASAATWGENRFAPKAGREPVAPDRFSIFRRRLPPFRGWRWRQATA